MRRVRVLYDVRGGVSRREGDRDNEVGGDEAEQREHEELALPTRKKVFEHRDRAFAVGAFVRDAVVDRERAEEREQNEYQRRDRREDAA